jgi:glycosyltransferase involved in cell wall biosynthesis
MRKRRKLTFVNRFFYPDESATSQMLSDLAPSLVQRGFDVQVLCSGQLYDDPGARLPISEVRLGVQVHRVGGTRFGRRQLLGRAVDYFSFYAACGLHLLRTLSPGDIVIAKTDPPLVSVVCALAAKWRHAILINWQQDVFPEVASVLGANPLPIVLDAILRRARNWSLRTARMNVAIGGRMREYLENLGIPGTGLCVIENWADAFGVTPRPPSASALRRRLGLMDRFVVGYSGNLGRAHEFDTLLAAAEALRDVPEFAFLIIGGGAKMPAFKQAAAARCLTSVVFLPYQARESLGDSLSAADLHVVSLLPALEGLIVPSKFYGILAAGRPVVFIGDTEGELARIVRADACGIAIKQGDSTELVRQLRRLRDDASIGVDMGERARRLLVEKYTLNAGVCKWEALLAEVSAEGG